MTDGSWGSHLKLSGAASEMFTELEKLTKLIFAHPKGGTVEAILRFSSEKINSLGSFSGLVIGKGNSLV